MKRAAAPAVAHDGLRRLIETALPIAEQRAQMVAEIRVALMEGDEDAALALMRRYVGLRPEAHAS